MKITTRNLHRDVAYFYIGLIIAFSFSGIILNHRQDWYPMDYSYESTEVQLTIPAEVAELDSETYLRKASEKWELGDAYDGHRIRGNELRVFFIRITSF